MRICALGLFLVLVSALSAADNDSNISVRLKMGDDPRWAAPGWDDHDWKEIELTEVPSRAGPYWVRIHLKRPQTHIASCILGLKSTLWYTEDPNAPIDGIFIPAVFSFDLFWDGQRLERSGVVGSSRATEKVGPLDHLTRIPDGLLGPGTHLLALRISSYHFNYLSPQFVLSLTLDNYERRFLLEAHRPIFPLIGVVSSLLMAAVGLVMYWYVDRRRPLLLSSGSSLAIALFYALIATRWLYNGPYDWNLPRGIAVSIAMAVIACLVPWLLSEQLVVSRRYLWALLPALPAAWLFSPWYDGKVLAICRVMFGLSLVIVARASLLRRPGARPIFFGLLVGLVASFAFPRQDGREFLDPSFFVIFVILMLLIFVLLGVQLQSDRRRAQQAMLTAARLEVELLKKNLQPHFLLNTLTALSEVVEQNPRQAVGLIDDLAEEFRVLSRMTGEALVPLGRELDLCRAHLRVMSLRTGTARALEVSGADAAALVPPALFLTLIENGFTHQCDGVAGDFRLGASALPGGGVSYVFTSPGDVSRDPERPAGGTGLRYVKARLEESFPGLWTYRDGPTAAGWETVIELRRTA